MVMILFVLMDMRMLDNVNNDESMNCCAFINIIAYEKVIMLITTPREWRRSSILEEDMLESVSSTSEHSCYTGIRERSACGHVV